MFISATRTAEPGYLAERHPEQEELRLISWPELRFFRRRPSDSAVTGRQGRAFRVRTSWRPVTVRRARPTCQATAPGGLASPVRARRRGAGLARATSRNRTSLHLPRPLPALPGPACRASARPARPPVDHARTHERTDSHLITDRQPHTIIIPPAIHYIVLQEWTCISLGVRWKVQIGH